ncbi:hypothetical protein CSUI_006520, partial [Cystoisospora suis]
AISLLPFFPSIFLSNPSFSSAVLTVLTLSCSPSPSSTSTSSSSSSSSLSTSSFSSPPPSSSPPPAFIKLVKAALCFWSNTLTIVLFSSSSSSSSRGTHALEGAREISPSEREDDPASKQAKIEARNVEKRKKEKEEETVYLDSQTRFIASTFCKAAWGLVFLSTCGEEEEIASYALLALLPLAEYELKKRREEEEEKEEEPSFQGEEKGDEEEDVTDIAAEAEEGRETAERMRDSREETIQKRRRGRKRSLLSKEKKQKQDEWRLKEEDLDIILRVFWISKSRHVAETAAILLDKLLLKGRFSSNQEDIEHATKRTSRIETDLSILLQFALQHLPSSSRSSSSSSSSCSSLYAPKPYGTISPPSAARLLMDRASSNSSSSSSSLSSSSIRDEKLSPNRERAGVVYSFASRVVEGFWGLASPCVKNVSFLLKVLIGKEREDKKAEGGGEEEDDWPVHSSSSVLSSLTEEERLILLFYCERSFCLLRERCDRRDEEDGTGSFRERKKRRSRERRSGVSSLLSSSSSWGCKANLKVSQRRGRKTGEEDEEMNDVYASHDRRREEKREKNTSRRRRKRKRRRTLTHRREEFDSEEEEEEDSGDEDEEEEESGDDRENNDLHDENRVYLLQGTNLLLRMFPYLLHKLQGERRECYLLLSTLYWAAFPPPCLSFHISSFRPSPLLSLSCSSPLLVCAKTSPSFSSVASSLLSSLFQICSVSSSSSSSPSSLTCREDHLCIRAAYSCLANIHLILSPLYGASLRHELLRLHTALLRQVSRHLDTIQNLVFIHPAKKRRNPSSKEDRSYLLQQEGEERDRKDFEEKGSNRKEKERVNKDEQQMSQAYLDSQREDENAPPVFSLDRVMKNPMYVDILRDLVSQLEGDFLRLATFYSTCSSVLEGNEEEEERDGFFFTSERKKMRGTDERREEEEGKETGDRDDSSDRVNLAVVAGVEAAVSTLHMRVMASNTYGTAQVYVHPKVQEEEEGKKKNGSFEVPSPRLVLHACDLLLAVYEHLAVRSFALYARLTDTLQRVAQLQTAFLSSSSGTSGAIPPRKRQSQSFQEESVMEDLQAGKEPGSSAASSSSRLRSSSLALMDRPDKDLLTNDEEKRKRRRRASEECGEADGHMKNEDHRGRTAVGGEEGDPKHSERRDVEVEEIDLLSSSSSPEKTMENRSERKKEELKRAMDEERENARRISRTLQKTLVDVSSCRNRASVLLIALLDTDENPVLLFNAFLTFLTLAQVEKGLEEARPACYAALSSLSSSSPRSSCAKLLLPSTSLSLVVPALEPYEYIDADIEALSSAFQNFIHSLLPSSLSSAFGEKNGSGDTPEVASSLDASKNFFSSSFLSGDKKTLSDLGLQMKMKNTKKRKNEESHEKTSLTSSSSSSSSFLFSSSSSSSSVFSSSAASLFSSCLGSYPCTSLLSACRYDDGAFHLLESLLSSSSSSLSSSAIRSLMPPPSLCVTSSLIAKEKEGAEDTLGREIGRKDDLTLGREKTDTIIMKKKNPSSLSSSCTRLDREEDERQDRRERDREEEKGRGEKGETGGENEDQQQEEDDEEGKRLLFVARSTLQEQLAIGCTRLARKTCLISPCWCFGGLAPSILSLLHHPIASLAQEARSFFQDLKKKSFRVLLQTLLFTAEKLFEEVLISPFVNRYYRRYFEQLRSSLPRRRDLRQREGGEEEELHSLETASSSSSCDLLSVFLPSCEEEEERGEDGLSRPLHSFYLERASSFACDRVSCIKRIRRAFFRKHEEELGARLTDLYRWSMAVSMGRSHPTSSSSAIGGGGVSSASMPVDQQNEVASFWRASLLYNRQVAKEARKGMKQLVLGEEEKKKKMTKRADNERERQEEDEEEERRKKRENDEIKGGKGDEREEEEEERVKAMIRRVILGLLETGWNEEKNDKEERGRKDRNNEDEHATEREKEDRSPCFPSIQFIDFLQPLVASRNFLSIHQIHLLERFARDLLMNDDDEEEEEERRTGKRRPKEEIDRERCRDRGRGGGWKASGERRLFHAVRTGEFTWKIQRSSGASSSHLSREKRRSVRSEKETVGVEETAAARKKRERQEENEDDEEGERRRSTRTKPSVPGDKKTIENEEEERRIEEDKRNKQHGERRREEEEEENEEEERRREERKEEKEKNRMVTKKTERVIETYRGRGETKQREEGDLKRDDKERDRSHLVSERKGGDHSSSLHPCERHFGAEEEKEEKRKKKLEETREEEENKVTTQRMAKKASEGTKERSGGEKKSREEDVVDKKEKKKNKLRDEEKEEEKENTNSKHEPVKKNELDMKKKKNTIGVRTSETETEEEDEEEEEWYSAYEERKKKKKNEGGGRNVVEEKEAKGRRRRRHHTSSEEEETKNERKKTHLTRHADDDEEEEEKKKTTGNKKKKKNKNEEDSIRLSLKQEEDEKKEKERRRVDKKKYPTYDAASAAFSSLRIPTDDLEEGEDEGEREKTHPPRELKERDEKRKMREGKKMLLSMEEKDKRNRNHLSSISPQTVSLREEEEGEEEDDVRIALSAWQETIVSPSSIDRETQLDKRKKRSPQGREEEDDDDLDPVSSSSSSPYSQHRSRRCLDQEGEQLQEEKKKKKQKQQRNEDEDELWDFPLFSPFSDRRRSPSSSSSSRLLHQGEKKPREEEEGDEENDGLSIVIDDVEEEEGQERGGGGRRSSSGLSFFSEGDLPQDTEEKKRRRHELKPETGSFIHIKTAKQEKIPRKRHEEDEEDDTWSVFSSASSFLSVQAPQHPSKDDEDDAGDSRDKKEKAKTMKKKKEEEEPPGEEEGRRRRKQGERCLKGNDGSRLHRLSHLSSLSFNSKEDEEEDDDDDEDRNPFSSSSSRHDRGEAKSKKKDEDDAWERSSDVSNVYSESLFEFE